MIRRRLSILAASALLAAASATSAASAAGSSWTPSIREKMLTDAVRTAPPALARIILMHPDALRKGMEEPALSEGTAPHRQEGDDRSPGAAASLAAAAERAIRAIDGHRPMAEVVHALGVVAHIAADLNDPLLTSRGGSSAEFGPSFASFAERNMNRFPVVFYGYAAAGEDAIAPIEEAALSSAAMARGYFAHIERAYAADRPGASFDIRSIPFAVASICYSRAVTGIARTWLHVWRSARGDLTGTPYLPGAPPIPASLKGAAPRPRERSRASADEGPGSAQAGVASAPAAGPEAAPITKTIIGKSRKRLSKASPEDPNARTPARDPNGRETTDASED